MHAQAPLDVSLRLLGCVATSAQQRHLLLRVQPILHPELQLTLIAAHGRQPRSRRVASSGSPGVVSRWQQAVGWPSGRIDGQTTVVPQRTEWLDLAATLRTVPNEELHAIALGHVSPDEFLCGLRVARSTETRRLDEVSRCCPSRCPSRCQSRCSSHCPCRHLCHRLWWCSCSWPR